MNTVDDNLFAVPYVCLYEQLERAFSTLQIENMKTVAHEDDSLNSDYSVDPLADPRLDKMDLFNMVDSQDRDKVLNANDSFCSMDGDVMSDTVSEVSSAESSSDSGSGE